MRLDMFSHTTGVEVMSLATMTGDEFFNAFEAHARKTGHPTGACMRPPLVVQDSPTARPFELY